MWKGGVSVCGCEAMSSRVGSAGYEESEMRGGGNTVRVSEMLWWDWMIG